MAKLNGVKTLDMVNGEITKVSYDGDVYAAVKDFTLDTIKVGDIVLPKEWNPDVTVGAFYEVVKDFYGDFPTIKDDAGYNHSNVLVGDLVLFRKVSENKPKLKAGDFVKFAEDGLGITAGKAYEVEQIRNGMLYVLDDIGCRDYRVGRGSDFEIVPESEAKWLKIGRKVNEYRVGDIVRLLDGDGGGLRGYEGIITKIIEEDGLCLPYRLEKPDFVESESNTWYQAEKIELIAPVESTLN